MCSAGQGLFALQLPIKKKKNVFSDAIKCEMDAVLIISLYKVEQTVQH